MRSQEYLIIYKYLNVPNLSMPSLFLGHIPLVFQSDQIFPGIVLDKLL